MTDILNQLRRDHAHIGQVMQVLSKELDALEAGGSADFGLLEDIMRYITGYSDVHHHPAEDVVYAELLSASPDVADELGAVVAEHDVLIDKGREFLETIEAVEEEAFVRRDKFVRLGRDYLTTLGRHMGVEEQRLFPLAAEALSADAWAAVAKRRERRPDPLFGPAIDAEYRHLWERIQAHCSA